MPARRHRPVLEKRFLPRSAAGSPLGAITLAGYLHKQGPWPQRVGLRYYGHYAAVYVYSGAGTYEDSNGLSLPVTAGDLILIFPTVGHRYGPPPRGQWQELYLVFDGPVFDLWQAQRLLDPLRPVHHLEPIDYWLRRLDSVLGAPGQLDVSPPLLEVCRLQQVLAEALRGDPAHRPPQQVHWAARACALLEADPAAPLDLPAVARQMKTSYASFRRRFTAALSMPPARYRAQRLIERAGELMQRGDLTDKQIAAQLGFCDEFHFSRRFKQLTGHSPRQFRRGML